jgi:hypothetical protein
LLGVEECSVQKEVQEFEKCGTLLSASKLHRLHVRKAREEEGATEVKRDQMTTAVKTTANKGDHSKDESE